MTVGTNPPIWKYVAKRLVLSLPVFLITITIVFSLIHLAPGSPVTFLVGEGWDVSPEYVKRIEKQYGLDRPVYEQYFVFISNLLQGNLGFSFTFNSPVTALILQKLPATALLMLTSLIVSSIVGILVGVLITKKPFGLLDKFVSVLSLVGYSFPIFVVGLFLLYSLSLRLGLFPMGGIVSIGKNLNWFEYPVDVLSHLFLPALVLGFYHFAFVNRLTRASMLDTIRKDFMTTARSKGLSENAVLFKHGLKNAFLPVLTNIGVRLGLSFAGAALTETVFSWPGIGRLLYTGMIARDYPVIMGIFIFISICVILANLVTDVLYAYIDPRIRLT